MSDVSNGRDATNGNDASNGNSTNGEIVCEMTREELIQELNKNRLENFGEFVPTCEPRTCEFPPLNKVRFPLEYEEDLSKLKVINAITLWKKKILEIIESNPTNFNDFIEHQIASVALEWRQSQIEGERTYLKNFGWSLEKKCGTYLLFKLTFDTPDPIEQSKIEKGCLLKIRYGEDDEQVIDECRVISIDLKNCSLVVKYDHTELPNNEDLDDLDEIDYSERKAFKIQTCSTSQAIIRALNCLKANNQSYFVNFDNYNETPDIIHTPNASITQAIKHFYHVNDSQAVALWCICTSTSGKLPFILRGPCGTGKTTIMSAVISCLMDMNKNHRILMCTSTNSNADTIGLELMNTFKDSDINILRLRSIKNDYHNRDKNLDPISCLDHEMANFAFPDKEEYEKCNVIISTASSSKNIADNDILPGFFSHIFIDEASSIKNCDFFLPIGNFATEKTSVVLCGDHMQMSPISNVNIYCSSFTHCESVLHHFMSKACYENNLCLTSLLTQSYQGLTPMLKLLDLMFFENKAQFIGNPYVASDDLKPFLLNEKFPIIFRQIRGVIAPKRQNTNQNEVDQLVEQIKKFLKGGIKAKEIGVVSPYKAQKQQVVSRLETEFPEQCQDIMVETVERFQGTTRRVVFLLTTRTERIGFLDEERRIYTAITRSTELLVVFGYESCLKDSWQWKQLMKVCRNNGTFVEERALKRKNDGTDYYNDSD